MSEETVDTDARAEIKVLNHKFDSLSESLKHHMEYEEKQRERLEDTLNSIKKRMMILTMVVAGASGATASTPGIKALLGM